MSTILRLTWNSIFKYPYENVVETLLLIKSELRKTQCSLVYKPFIIALWLFNWLFLGERVKKYSLSIFFQNICSKYPHIKFIKFTIPDLLRITIQSIFLLLFFTDSQRKKRIIIQQNNAKISATKSVVAFFRTSFINPGRELVAKLNEKNTSQARNDRKIRFLRFKWLRITLILLMLGLSVWAIVVPFEPLNQLIFSLVLWVVALWLRSTPGRLATLIMMMLSILMSSRYIWWRMTTSLNIDDGIGFVLGLGLLAAEIYTWLVLVMGYIQTAWPLQRRIVQLPKDHEQWPSVDIFVPTYNEPLKVLIPTVFAAQNIDWPHDKLNVFVLDDGKRENIKTFCEQNNINYMTRPDNSFAKAGNLNHALTKTKGEFVAIFDCDHVPVRSFLQMTMGGFIKNKNLALVQTPHHFFSPDPFERNLDVFNEEPNEGELFYGQIQDGNDLWNATFFCGSCAVLRREPLEEVGGIATETVTEDAHTALKLHRLGYDSSYVNLKQAAGLATESISAHIGQRIRWARGMLQIFRVDNPLLGRGLSFMQRICYSNAMLHFFYGLPRLVFLTAPLTFLLLHTYIIYAPVETIFLYVVPAIFLANLTNSRHQGQYRNTFWAELYESVLAWYIFRPTLIALINPGKGKFNVTEKGGIVDKDYFDWGIGVPYLILIALNILGLTFGVWRIGFGPESEISTIIMNMIWTVYNLMVLGGVMAIITESKQVRIAHRIQYKLPFAIYTKEGFVYEAIMNDYSESGIGLEVVSTDDIRFKLEDKITVVLRRDEIIHSFETTVKFVSNNKLGVKFDDESMDSLRKLIQVTFSRADAWEIHSMNRDKEIISSRLVSIFKIGMKGYASLFFYLHSYIKDNMKPLYHIGLYLLSFLPKSPRLTNS
ncbi:UDP-forming cellulose synthase catalytic subunit [Psychrosphaera sp. F3M07]|uniref:UDP-forming cellulose synthase catalytic subunit n=1 Tax=Psychrosphaera sp. F3M07 TaxID=2841560 RepID=UPI002090D527|nr:UDP-forming cellulose synthase catalytic subunit [Psychrosphaera sp. F3M07]